MAAAMLFVFNAHDERGFEAVVADLPIVDVLRDLALSDWMLGTDAESIVRDAAGNWPGSFAATCGGCRSTKMSEPPCGKCSTATIL